MLLSPSQATALCSSAFRGHISPYGARSRSPSKHTPDSLWQIPGRTHSLGVQWVFKRTAAATHLTLEVCREPRVRSLAGSPAACADPSSPLSGENYGMSYRSFTGPHRWRAKVNISSAEESQGNSHTFPRKLCKCHYCTKVKVAQSCPTLCDPMNYIFHGILQARILEWVVFLFSKGSSQPRDRTQVSHIAGGFFTK